MTLFRPPPLTGILLILGMTILAPSPLSAVAPPRGRECLNPGWRFLFADPVGAAAPDFDDSAWAPVGLPHSFSLPYFLSADFPVGTGWYRREISLDADALAGRVWLEFEGAFQEAEVYLNGQLIDRHRGGYTGFCIDATAAAHAGRNLLAVRVDNTWRPDLAPRAGEHVFSGGLYRDVWLHRVSPVHVPWHGVGVVTPEVSAESATVGVSTELRNEGNREVEARVNSRLIGPDGREVAIRETKVRVAPAGTATITQEGPALVAPALWHPRTPRLHRVVTRVFIGNDLVDELETAFGIRRFDWTADRGFFINGEHHYFKGANAHQDQAGWGDAVTNAALARDVRQIKAAGFDFVRGSHYPHDPVYGEICDLEGMLYLPELCFWGTASFKNPWGSSAYPTDPAEQERFDDNLRNMLRELVRTHRNHPSIVGWSLGNEVFFTDGSSMPRVRALLTELAELARRLDPTRAVVIGGAQRGDIHRLGDVAGYNGDGARLFIEPGVPSFVAEYGSTVADRPGEFSPGWGDLPGAPGQDPAQPYPWRYPWRSGEVLWCAFDHGSIAGRFGRMGMVDYARLPKRQWYWYRQAYLGIAPPAWPVPGRAASLRLETATPVVSAVDGTDDAQLVVTLVGPEGRPVDACPPVTLTIESGPGEFPTGREITFAADSDITIRDGQAAIAMRAYQSGKTTVVARSPGLPDARLDLEFRGGPAFVPGVTHLTAPRAYMRFDSKAALLRSDLELFGTQTPTRASSEREGHAGRLANDGDPTTAWRAMQGVKDPWWQTDLERIVEIRAVKLTFPSHGDHRFVVEASLDGANWSLVDDYSHVPGSDHSRICTPPKGVVGRFLRVTFRTSEWGPAPALADIEVRGKPDTR